MSTSDDAGFFEISLSPAMYQLRWGGRPHSETLLDLTGQPLARFDLETGYGGRDFVEVDPQTCRDH